MDSGAIKTIEVQYVRLALDPDRYTRPEIGPVERWIYRPDSSVEVEPVST